MLIKCQWLFLLLCSLITLSSQSIAGVTYMDHFDFEERYRDVTECDPFHWYPLHLPPHCAKMYEDLIRKGITSLTNTPIRIVKEREKQRYNPNPSLINASPPDDTQEFVENYEMSPLTPYSKMFQMLRQDVMKDPSSPVITNVPGMGAVALYKQPISRKSGQYIKKIAKIYRNVQSDFNNFYSPPTTEKSEEITNSTEASEKGDGIKDDIKKLFSNKINRARNGRHGGFNVKDKKRIGNLLTVLRTKHN